MRNKGVKENTNAIRSWAIDERPRERMAWKGPQALSDAELIAILIQSGTPNRSALAIAQEILKIGSHNLVELGRKTTKELEAVKGIGLARATTLVAALELGRRRQISLGKDQKKLHNSRDAVNILIPLMQDLLREHFCVLCMAASNKILHWEFVSVGGLTSTTVDLKVIFKTALQQGASRIIVAHNHPSGNPKPSNADRQITQKLQLGAKALDIQLIDHIIIADNLYYSFADEGLL